MRRTALFVCAVIGLAACGDNIHLPGDGATLQATAPLRVQAGDVIPVACTLLKTDNTTEDVTATATIDVQSASLISRVGSDIIAHTVGLVDITCSLPDEDLTSDPTHVRIVAGPPAELITTITPNPATAGDTVTASCQVFDSEGNAIDDQAPTLTVTPTDPANTVSGLSAVMTRAGHYDGECALPGAQSNDAGFDVVPGLPAILVLGKNPDQPFYSLNTDIAITSVVTDRFGNEIPNVMVNVTSKPITGGGVIANPAPSTFSYNTEGKYEIDGSVVGATDGNQPVTAAADIFIDEFGPKVSCAGPGDGAMIIATPGTQMTFQGIATDVNGTSAVAIDGNNVTLSSNGTFSGPIPVQFGINFVQVTATDTFGVPNTKICTFLASPTYASPSAPLGGAVALSLGQGAVDDGNRSGPIGSLGDLLSTILNSTGIRSTIDASLRASNPLAKGCLGGTLFGVCIGISYTITYLSSTIDGPNNVALALVNGGINTTAVINGVHLDLNIGGFGTSGTVDISSITVGLELVPAVSGGVPHISIANVSTSVGSISTNFSGLTGAIINIIAGLAESTLRGEVQNLVQNYVTNNFGSAIDGIVSGLNLNSISGSFSVPRLFGGGTVPLNIGIAFSTLDTNTSRLRFGIGTSVTSTIANAFSTLGVAVPPGGILGDPAATPGNTAVGVNVALINQALHALWRANWLAASVAGTAIDASAPPDLQITMDARLPPVANLLPDGSVQLSLGDIDLAASGGTLPPGLVITAGARAHTSVVLAGNTLSFGAIALDDVEVSLDALNLSASDKSLLMQVIQNALPQLVSSSLQNALPSFPIPSFPIPASLGAFGIPIPSTFSVLSPSLQIAPPELVLHGSFGIQ
jgi:hypothetical protein